MDRKHHSKTSKVGVGSIRRCLWWGTWRRYRVERRRGIVGTQRNDRAGSVRERRREGGIETRILCWGGGYSEGRDVRLRWSSKRRTGWWCSGLQCLSGISSLAGCLARVRCSVGNEAKFSQVMPPLGRKGLVSRPLNAQAMIVQPQAPTPMSGLTRDMDIVCYSLNTRGWNRGMSFEVNSCLHYICINTWKEMNK